MNTIAKVADSVLMWFLKIVVTIICPPIGLAWISKSVGGLVMGVIVSVLFTVLGIKVFLTTPVYDNPQIEIRPYPSDTSYGLVELVAFPVLFLSSPKDTVLKDGDNYYHITGDKVVVFDPVGEKYVLDVNEDSSVSASVASVKNAEADLEACLKEKNLIKIRNAKGVLEREKRYLQESSAKSKVTRAAFQKAIDQMNKEYGELQAYGIKK